MSQLSLSSLYYCFGDEDAATRGEAVNVMIGGKVAVVAGGSSGIGAACARLLAAAGAQVVVGYNNGANRAAALVAELPGNGHQAMYLPMEDSAQIRKAAAAVGGADILINSAGFTRNVCGLSGGGRRIRTFGPPRERRREGGGVDLSTFAGWIREGRRDPVPAFRENARASKRQLVPSRTSVGSRGAKGKPGPRNVTGSSQRSPLYAAETPRCLHFGKCACKQAVTRFPPTKERRARPTQMADKIIMRAVEA
jgi:hypothetical protein